MQQKNIFKTKQMAFDVFELQRKEFLDYARWTARKICQEKGHVTTDDVREIVQLPKGIDGRVYGAIFNNKEWVKTGYTQTKVTSSHGRIIAVYTLA